MLRLAHREFGGEGKPPVVILHGLLGSSRNWTAAGGDLAEHFQVFALDLRNHGDSPHASGHTYELMAQDVLGWLDEQGLQRVHLIGHSMGGKVAMRLACRHADRVSALVVVDIAPRPKAPKHKDELQALRALPLHELSSRAEADQMLAAHVPSWGMRQFLLTNLVRREEGGFGWLANLPVLAREINRTGEAPIGEGDRFEGRVRWVVGGKSDFVCAADHGAIRRHFPQAQIEIFRGSGHNPHVEERARFSERVGQFLRAE